MMPCPPLRGIDVEGDIAGTHPILGPLLPDSNNATKVDSTAQNQPSQQTPPEAVQSKHEAPTEASIRQSQTIKRSLGAKRRRRKLYLNPIVPGTTRQYRDVRFHERKQHLVWAASELVDKD